MKRSICVIVLIATLLVIVSCFIHSVGGRVVLNNWQYVLKKVDDNTSYGTRRDVENTCRAMIASYTADKLKYEQYASSDSSEQRSWGEQAKIRANQTAATYNNYILKNSYVFNGNVPSDIAEELDYLQ